MSWLDWLSVAGSVASLVSLLVSVITVYLAYQINTAVRKLARKAAFEARRAEIVSEVQAAVDRIQSELDDFSSQFWKSVSQFGECVIMANRYDHAYDSETAKTVRSLTRQYRELQKFKRKCRAADPETMDDSKQEKLWGILMSSLEQLQDYKTSIELIMKDKQATKIDD